MEIWNHFTFRKDLHPLTANYILEKGIPYDYGEILSAVDISENNPCWNELSELLSLEKNTYLSETIFTKNELFSADWLTMRCRWYFDYPQPENKYTKITYTNEYLCSEKECGWELIQTDSFRLKKTPKWGKRNLCMTNWVYDELFISEKARAILGHSNLSGFSFVNVLNKSGNAVLSDICQLQIPYILPKSIESSSDCIAEIHNCPICGKEKLLLNGRGQLLCRKESFLNAPDFAKTWERFGSGLIASRRIIVSHNAYKFIVENKLDSSLIFEPVKLV